jgi:hypothetical protein
MSETLLESLREYGQITPYGTIHVEEINARNSRRYSYNVIFNLLNCPGSEESTEIDFGTRVAEVDILMQLLNNFGEYTTLISTKSHKPYTYNKGLRVKISSINQKLAPTPYIIERNQYAEISYKIVRKESTDIAEES